MSKNNISSQNATDERAEQMLWDCLKEIPFVQIAKVEQRIIPDPGKPEIVARIKVAEREKLILAEVKPNGDLRLVREAIAGILKYRETYADSYGLVIAPCITTQAARICRQEGIGYLDFCGNAYLSFDFIFISKTGRTEAVAKKKTCRSWCSPRAERVTRTLLMHPKRVWKLRELAQEAHVTPAQALNLKSHLVRGKWITDVEQGFQLTEPGLLLDDWVKNYLLTRSTERIFSSSRSVVETEVALAAICQEQIIPYALMGFSAAMRYDPMFHSKRVSAYVLSDLSKVVAALELTEATPGKGNVNLWIPYDEGVLRGAQQFDHAKITPPVQTYLDLTKMEDGEKPAHQVWESFIKTGWEPVPVAA